MILEIVKQKISDVEFEPFNIFYMRYVLDVQDSNIDREIKSSQSKFELNPNNADKLLFESIRKLVDVYDRNK